MKKPRENWPTNPRDAGYHKPADESSLEFFASPSDPFDQKDGKKLSDEEAVRRALAHMDQFGSENDLVD